MTEPSNPNDSPSRERRSSNHGVNSRNEAQGFPSGHRGGSYSAPRDQQRSSQVSPYVSDRRRRSRSPSRERQSEGHKYRARDYDASQMSSNVSGAIGSIGKRIPHKDAQNKQSNRNKNRNKKERLISSHKFGPIKFAVGDLVHFPMVSPHRGGGEIESLKGTDRPLPPGVACTTDEKGSTTITISFHKFRYGLIVEIGAPEEVDTLPEMRIAPLEEFPGAGGRLKDRRDRKVWHKYLNIRDEISMSGYRENPFVPEEWTLVTVRIGRSHWTPEGVVCLENLTTAIGNTQMERYGRLTEPSLVRLGKMNRAYRAMMYEGDPEKQQEAVGEFTFFLKGRAEHKEYLASLAKSRKRSVVSGDSNVERDNIEEEECSD